ncbi:MULTISPECIES: RloB family protein [unclassified Endozoicomonas]|uniref:RloB family protein n=2 Tax=Endozoicomonas TaxID=305899 RepID=UPI002148811E|nr:MULTISPECIES: RloB family protein [unclassified Endozoicomonas]
MMGSEDLFHKRKARKAEDNKRNQAKRKPYDRALIVSEGEKTEPFYFEEIRLFHDLDSANIEIDGSCDSSPINVVNYAYNLYRRELLSGDTYNVIFCIFDRDRHSTFFDAIQRVDEINTVLAKDKLDDEVKFIAITSNPAFEFWLLLHYNATTKPYAPTQKKSVADQAIDDLRKYLPEYKKTQRGLYEKSIIEGTLAPAIAHSSRIFAKANRNNDAESCTNVHELVVYLQNMKEIKNDA